MIDNSTATSAPGASLLPEGTAALTTIHFALIAILAVLVIAGIIWGIRQKRARVQAEQDIISNAHEAGVPPVAPPSTATMPPPAETSATASRVTRDPDALTGPDTLSDHPIAAATAFEATPASEAAPEAAPAREPTITSPTPSPALAQEPVTLLKGLGPKVAARLDELGVTTIGQLAALDDGAAETLDAQLGTFSGRMARDRWIEQARFLAAGDKAGFEAIFGKL